MHTKKKHGEKEWQTEENEHNLIKTKDVQTDAEVLKSSSHTATEKVDTTHGKGVQTTDTLRSHTSRNH